MKQSDTVFDPTRRWVASRLLAGEPCIRHAITTRRMAQSAEERGEIVRRLQSEAGWGERRIALAEQVHGAECATVRENDLNGIQPGEARTYPGADALVTRCSGVTLAIFTADCVPVLFADAEAGIAGAVHAGWRGTMGHVLKNAIELAIGLGAQSPRIRLWIGPAISGAAYEVSEDLAFRFAHEFPECAASAVRGRLVDLPEINRREALGLGLQEENVSVSGLCTMANPEDFFSYRVEGARAGRMASAIMALPDDCP